MKISGRSVLVAGLTTATAAAIAVAPPAPPASPPRQAPAPAVQLTAQSQPFVDRTELAAWLAAAQRRSPDSSAVPLVVAPSAQPQALAAFPGLGNAIINTYNVVEYWVDYGVDVAAYALGWIPFGWVAGDQIQIFYNDLIEPIARTITYNIANWIGGSVSFGQGVNNVILDSANAGIGFLNAEIRWGFGLLPPLPFPPPQIPSLPWFSSAQQAGVPAETETTAPSVDEAAPPARRQGPLSTAIHTLAGVTDGVAERVQDRIEAGREKPSVDADLADAHGNRVVRAQSETRAAVTGLVTDATKALRAGRSAPAAEATRKAPSAVAKSLGDTARKVVKDVRQGLKKARDRASASGAADAAG